MISPCMLRGGRAFCYRGVDRNKLVLVHFSGGGGRGQSVFLPASSFGCLFVCFVCLSVCEEA